MSARENEEEAEPGQPGPVDAARAALAARAGGPEVAVVTVVDGPGAGARLLVYENGEIRGSLAGGGAVQQAALRLAADCLRSGRPKTAKIEDGGVVHTLYGEAHRATESLVIAGAGHIAVPLARIGAMLDFRVVVLDDREEFATPERFPDAAEVRPLDFGDLFRDVAIGPSTYLVLVTRGHQHDYDCLERVLRSERRPAYVGMVGSRRRIRAAFHALLEGGIPRERLLGVRAPIGMDIGSETPEEIAVSIAAELVAVRRGHDAAGSLSARERVLDRLLPEEPSRAGTNGKGVASG